MDKAAIEELAQRACKGDEAALSEWLRFQLKTLPGIVNRRGVPVDDVDDVVQDILMNVVKSLGKFAGRSTFNTWHCRISRNRVADYFRKQQLYDRQFDNYQVARVAPDESLPEDVRDCIEELPEHYQQVIKLRLTGMNYGEIAKDLGLEYEAARSRHRLAVRLLRRRYHA